MLETIFHRTIAKYGMIRAGDGIVAGVSGGPDSTALLHLLFRFREHYDIKIVCAHLNHMFRPGDAEKDAEYVESFCRERGIPCTIKTVDVPEMAALQGLSPEQAGRKARYDLFNSVMKDKSFNKIAVAHNLDDQVETILMRLIRGSGVSGLGGIKPVRGDIIRPLSEAPRAEIESYCLRHGLKPVTDKTNFLPLYFRNKVRLNLLPCLREEYNSNVDRALLNMANILREEDHYLNQKAAEELNIIATGLGTSVIEFSIKDLLKHSVAMQRRILREGIVHILKDADNLELVHIDNIRTLIETGTTGKMLNLPRGLIAKVLYGKLVLTGDGPEHKKLKGVYSLVIPGRTDIPEIMGGIEAFVSDIEAYNRVKDIKDNNHAFLDFENAGRVLTVTGRKEGDRFVPLGMNGTKKLKDFFIDKKVPGHKRDMIPIVRNNLGIVWIAGYRIDERFKVSRDTKKVLNLKLQNT